MGPKRMVVELAVVATALYAVAVGALFVMQDGMLFPRGAVRPPVEPLPAAAEHWTLTSADGATLYGVHLPPRDGDGPIVLGFPGNAWNAQDYAVFLHERLPDAHVVAFHYRGYAPSEGRPSERALVADGLAIVDRLRGRWPERAIVPVGASIGSGVAAAVLAERDVAGAVLISPFDSVRALAAARYPWVPVGWLLRHPFDSAARLETVERPVAVISAGRDQLVPPGRTAALLESVATLVDHHVFADAGHGDLYDEPRFGAVLADAVDAVVAAQGGAGTRKTASPVSQRTKRPSGGMPGVPAATRTTGT